MGVWEFVYVGVGEGVCSAGESVCTCVLSSLSVEVYVGVCVVGMSG